MLLLFGAVVLAMLAWPLPGLAQPGQDDPPPPPAEPAPEPEPPIVELPPPPEGRTSITLKVPPLPEEKKPPPKAAPPKPDPDPAPRAAPARRTYTPEPEPAYTPEPEPAYSPASEPEPAAPAIRTAKPKPKPKPKPKVRQPKRKPTEAVTPIRAIEPALPVVTIVEERRSFVAALPQPPYAPDDGSSTPLYLLFLLALAGTLLLGLAVAAPRLAFYWPQVFVPVIRERDAVSFFGLCLLASGMLAWAIVGTGL